MYLHLGCWMPYAVCCILYDACCVLCVVCVMHTYIVYCNVHVCCVFYMYSIYPYCICLLYVVCCMHVVYCISILKILMHTVHCIAYYVYCIMCVWLHISQNIYMFSTLLSILHTYNHTCIHNATDEAHQLVHVYRKTIYNHATS